MYIYKAKVLRVVDGDTIDLLIDLGFNAWKKERIRLSGINTPETRTKDLKEKEKGLLAKKDFFDINNMKELDFSESTTKNVYSKNSFVYEFLSSMRQRLNDPLGQRKKVN